VSNPFETYSDDVKPVWQQKRERSTAKRTETLQRKKSELEAKMEERGELSSLAKAAARGRVTALRDGPYGKDVRGLQSYMRTMTPSSAPALLKLVREAAWIARLTPAERLTLQEIVAHGIRLALSRNDMVASHEVIPFGEDDDDCPPVHQAIREHVKALPYRDAADVRGEADLQGGRL
jgi:hypothetical protein